MSGLGWNSRHGMPSLNHARQRLFNPSQVACRICEQVFTSTQSFISHIESHMLEDETSSRRQLELSLMSSNPFHPNFSLLTHTHVPSTIQNSYNLPMLQERNPFLGANPQLIGRPAPPQQPQLSLLGRSNFALRPQPVLSGLQLQQRAVEEPPNDCTKPFLSQLEQTLSSMERDHDNSVKSHVEMLDLSLKL